MMVEINEEENCIQRICKCGYKEEIEFYYLHFDKELDRENLNCHIVERCPKCDLYYDIVLDADDSEDGVEITVHVLNYRKQKDLFSFVKQHNEVF